LLRSIRAKLAAVVIAAVVTAVTLASLASAWREAARRISAKTGELHAIARTLATAVAPGLARSSKPEVAQTLSAIGRIPGIGFARVTDRVGQTVHQFGLGVVVGRDADRYEPNSALSPLSPLYLATYPVTADIISGGVVIGQLELIADLSELRDALMESALTALMAGALASLLGVALSHFLQRSISGPVLRLSKAMEDVASTRDYSVVVPKTSRDEVGNLVVSFNAMLREIRGRDEALAASRDSLEIKVQDRTRDLEAAKAAADQANAAKSDFLATVSHEIRTPMNGMLVMAELMAAGDLPPRLQRYAGTLVTSGQSLLAIINDILDFSKIEAGKLEIETVPCEPAAIVDDVVQLFHERAAAKNLDLAAYVSSTVPKMIAADPVRLRQIVTNLVNNALKFTAQGHVVVRVTATPAAMQGHVDLRIDVTDTGIGIAAEKLKTIFDPFTQEDQTTTRRFGGTGIGLTICNRLAGAMGGSIAVTSVQAEGSTFTLCVPVGVLEDARAAPRSADSQVREIVIALDEGAIRSVLVSALIDAGMTPRIASHETFRSGVGPRPAAIISMAQQIGQDIMIGHPWLAGSDRPVLIAVSKFGDCGAHDVVEGGAIDLALGLPLTSADVADCIAAIRGGRAALAKGTAGRQAVFDKPVNSLPFRGARILAADDSAVNREVLTEALSRLGLSVHCVDDGRAALDAFKDGSYDLIFMDGSMPVMDGFEASRAIRDHETQCGLAPIPIIALTAHVVGAGAGLWRDAGMSDCVTKPFTLANIETCLRRWIKSGRPAHVDDVILPWPIAGSLSEADAPPAADEPPLVDYDVLDSIRSMQAPGDDLVGRIIALYCQHAPIAFDRLRAAVPNGVPKEIGDAAHALKSLSRNVGAQRAGDLCDDIEMQARSGICADVVPKLEVLADVLDQTRLQLSTPSAISPRALRERLRA